MKKKKKDLFLSLINKKFRKKKVLLSVSSKVHLLQLSLKKLKIKFTLELFF